MLEDLLKDNSVAQILIERGIEQGIERGIEQGIEEGERRMAQVSLEGRFGPLSDDMRAALRTADEAILHDLAAHIASDTLEQVRARRCRRRPPEATTTFGQRGDTVASNVAPTPRPDTSDNPRRARQHMPNPSPLVWLAWYGIVESRRNG